MCILAVGRQTAQQMISDGVSALYLGQPQEAAFELKKYATTGALILYYLEPH